MRPPAAGSVDSSVQELVRQIEDNPDDPAAYVVYADHLQKTGDPRGELIALAMAAHGSEDDKPRRAHDRWFGRHADAFEIRVNRQIYDGHAVEWRYGFVRGLYLGHVLPFEQRLPLLKKVLAHESGRFLVELDLSAYHPGDMKKQIAAVLKRPPATLRSLGVSCHEKLGDLQPLVDRFPRLEEFDVSSQAYVLPVLPSTLVKLRCCALRPAVIARIAAQELPRLRQLHLVFGVLGRNGATLASMEPLLARTDLAITHLELQSCLFTRDLVRALLESPLFATVEELEVHGSLDADTRALLETLRPRLRELTYG